MTYPAAQDRRDASRLPAYRIAVPLIGSGIGHFAAPARFDAAMPTELPGDVRLYTYSSGIVEIAIGALLVPRRTRRTGARAAMAFFIVIFPVVLNGVRLSWHKGWAARAVASARLPLQISMILKARQISRYP
jgi:uncharacterized membrane protein